MNLNCTRRICGHSLEDHDVWSSGKSRCTKCVCADYDLWLIELRQPQTRPQTRVALDTCRPIDQWTQEERDEHRERYGYS